MGRCQALVAVPRGKIELRLLQVPPAPEEELPELVRFQALRQFTSLGEDWPLDFVQLQSADPQQVRVLAAAVAPAVVDEVRQVCAALESPPTSLVLRPFAAASFYSRYVAADRCRLMVELFAEEADLNVVAAGQVLLLRSVRLPTHDRDAALVGEIRRTLAAARNQLGDQAVEAVMLLGGEAELGSLPQCPARPIGTGSRVLRSPGPRLPDRGSTPRSGRPQRPFRRPPRDGVRRGRGTPAWDRFS